MTTNWFGEGGGDYARYRPDYPPDLAAFLAGLAPDRGCAVDVGCGSGQFTALLAEHFQAVIGLEPSADQLAHATPRANVRYRCAPAEALGLPDASANLITAAQAAHWFDRDAFYTEARRIAAPGAVLALVSYGIPECDAEISPRFDHFYRAEIGPYWPPERALVESGYAGIDFPFAELPFPAMAIRRDWSLAEFLGYVSTWSAVRNATKAGEAGIAERFAGALAGLWGDPERRRAVRWPITMRLGRL